MATVEMEGSEWLSVDLSTEYCWISIAEDVGSVSFELKELTRMVLSFLQSISLNVQEVNDTPIIENSPLILLQRLTIHSSILFSDEEDENGELSFEILEGLLAPIFHQLF